MGIFDSGVGGLTVLRRVAERLPHESIVYLGDTARVPYGTKSAETVVRYAKACANVLIDRGISLLVVACNTASAYALEALRHELTIPVIGVIDPGARRAVRSTRSGRIGVIGTKGTISSGAYQNAIAALQPDHAVFGQPCPLFVPLAEEGWLEGEVPLSVARTYLRPLLDHDIDTLVLGCTHYPLLKDVIAEAAGPGVTLIDSAEATAETVATYLQKQDNSPANQESRFHYLVTDDPDSFARVGRGFLGYAIDTVEWVDI
ncbi:MAG: glutamate racemase [Candidatus Hydrogenedentota bacterium]